MYNPETLRNCIPSSEKKYVFPHAARRVFFFFSVVIFLTLDEMQASAKFQMWEYHIALKSILKTIVTFLPLSLDQLIPNVKIVMINIFSFVLYYNF